MTDQVKNILIGLFITGALVITVGLILFLKPTVGDGKKTLLVRFSNIAGVTVGTRVSFAGKPVGEVTHIQEVEDARTQPDAEGRIYLYELTLKLDSSAKVYCQDEIGIKTTGLMGERSIAILPKAPPPGKTPILVTDRVVYANSTDALENTFNQVSNVAGQLETTVDRIDKWFDENQKIISRAISSFGGAMAQVDTFLRNVEEEKLVPTLHQSASLLNDNLELVRTGLDEDQLLHKCANLIEGLDQAANHFNNDGAQTLRNFNQITRDVASGSGSLGRFVVGDDFYMRLASIMNKGETLMNDINHYGILFQYNKQWQKSRTKKVTLLKALDTPQEFRNYFEGEVDSMTTSVGRLSELLDRAGNEEYSRIVQSQAFKHNFANLMRQVQGLTDSLKLYNEGLVAQSEAANGTE